MRPGTNESRSDVGTWQTGMNKIILNAAGARNPSSRVDGQRQNWLNQILSPSSPVFFGLFGLATGEFEIGILISFYPFLSIFSCNSGHRYRDTYSVNIPSVSSHRCCMPPSHPSNLLTLQNQRPCFPPQTVHPVVQTHIIYGCHRKLVKRMSQTVGSNEIDLARVSLVLS